MHEPSLTQAALSAPAFAAGDLAELPSTVLLDFDTCHLNCDDASLQRMHDRDWWEHERDEVQAAHARIRAIVDARACSYAHALRAEHADFCAPFPYAAAPHHLLPWHLSQPSHSLPNHLFHAELLRSMRDSPFLHASALSTFPHQPDSQPRVDKWIVMWTHHALLEQLQFCACRVAVNRRRCEVTGVEDGKVDAEVILMLCRAVECVMCARRLALTSDAIISEHNAARLISTIMAYIPAVTRAAPAPASVGSL